MASVSNFAVTAGEDQTLSMTARGSSGAVIDLTSAGISWRLMNRNGSTVMSKTGTVVSAAAGTFTVLLSDADTIGLADGNYTHEALITVSGTTTRGVSGKMRVSGQASALSQSSQTSIESGLNFYNIVAEAVAASPASTIGWIRTAGYYSVGDGGDALYKRAGGVPAHIGYFTCANGAIYELADNSRPNVRQFGAKGDASTDDTAAVNGMVDYLRAKVDESVETSGSFMLEFPKGEYRVTSPVDLTDIRTRVWGLRGPGVISGAFTSSYAVLDFTNSRWAKLEDLFVQSATGYTPGIGVLLSRNDGGSVSDVHQFDNVDIYGTFSIAGLYNYASEDFTHHKLKIVNQHTGSSSYCAIFDGTNSQGATSPFATIPANTAASFNDVQGTAFDARKPLGGPAIFIRRSSGLDIDGYAVSVDNSAIVLSTDSFGQEDLRLNIHCETTGLTNCIRFEGDASQTIRGLTFIDPAPQAANELFKSGAGVTSITLERPKIEVFRYAVTPSNGAFNTPSVFKFIRPDIAIYDGVTPKLLVRDGITLAASGAAIAHTGTTAETVLATVSIPAAIMGTKGALKVHTTWTMPSTANNKLLKVRFGAAGAGTSGTIHRNTTQTTTVSVGDFVMIKNRDATGSQVGSGSQGLASFGAAAGAVTTSAIDTTAATEIAITGQLADSGETLTLESYSVELLLAA